MDGLLNIRIYKSTGGGGGAGKIEACKTCEVW
jgi:hypothetical protein